MSRRERVAIVVTTYNSGAQAIACLRTCLAQSHANLHLYVADDGSTDDTVDRLRDLAEDQSRMTILTLPHQERGRARAAAIEEATRSGFDDLLFIDDDMVATPGLVEACLRRVETTGVQALVVPEIPWSRSKNYLTRVKVFERSVLNRAEEAIDQHSIEAARFWTAGAWEASGGLNPHQVSFEEIQPTLRWLDCGGKVLRVLGEGLYHNEKHVTFRSLAAKKAYYFAAMETTLRTEHRGVQKALSRWYFFRRTLYRAENLKAYAREPHLALGMVTMYVFLTGVAVFQLLRPVVGILTPSRRD